MCVLPISSAPSRARLPRMSDNQGIVEKAKQAFAGMKDAVKERLSSGGTQESPVQLDNEQEPAKKKSKKEETGDEEDEEDAEMTVTMSAEKIAAWNNCTDVAKAYAPEQYINHVWECQVCRPSSDGRAMQRPPLVPPANGNAGSMSKLGGGPVKKLPSHAQGTRRHASYVVLSFGVLAMMDK